MIIDCIARKFLFDGEKIAVDIIVCQPNKNTKCCVQPGEDGED